MVESHEAHPGSTLRLLLSVEGEDAKRLERLGEAGGMKPAEVLAELLRAADRSTA